MTDCSLLKWTAESLRGDLKEQRDDEWHSGTEHQRLVYRIERLKMFERYIELKQEFDSEL
jgi:hypothetical protein